MMTNRYKLMLKGNSANDQGVELYDLLSDPAEKNNLADKLPEITVKMQKEMKLWQESVLESLTGADYN